LGNIVLKKFMSKYTLYIDESGDFETNKGEWLVGGVLFASDVDSTDQLLHEKLTPLIKEFGLSGIKDFHLTEFQQKYGPDETLKRATDVFQKVNTLKVPCHFITVVNEEKLRLSSPEKTYRAMLSNLLSMIDDVIPDLDDLKHLDIVVATRTRFGIRLTTDDDLRKDVIGPQYNFLESDLTSLTLLNLLNHQALHVELDYASKRWGLVVADFICNISYHRKKARNKQLLDSLLQQNRFTLYEAFGNFNERRARNAEKNKDFALAMYRWLEIITTAKNPGTVTIAIRAFERSLENLVLVSGTSGSRFALEGLLEKIWRNMKQPVDRRSQALRAVKEQLEKCNILSENDRNYLCFHLDNLRLLWFTREGSTKDALAIADSQSKQLPLLTGSPETLMLVLDFKRLETEIYVNEMNFAKAAELAHAYENLLRQYEEVWELLDIVNEGGNTFRHSEFWMTSESMLLRIYVLNREPGLEERLTNLYEKILDKPDSNAKRSDLSRILNLRAFYLSLNGNLSEALSCYSDISNLSRFDFRFALFVINNAIGTISESSAKELLKNLIPLTQKFTNEVRYPMVFVWMEYALSCFYFENNSKNALKAIRKAKNYSECLDGDLSLKTEKAIAEIDKVLKTGKISKELNHLRAELIL